MNVKDPSTGSAINPHSSRVNCSPIPEAGQDGWTEWQAPIMQGYRMQCCDCGLVHEVEFYAAKWSGDLPNGEWQGERLNTDEYRVAFRMRRETLNHAEPDAEYKERCPHGLRWENAHRCRVCNAPPSKKAK